MRVLAYPAEDPKKNPDPEQLMPVYLYLMGRDSKGVHGQQIDAQPKKIMELLFYTTAQCHLCELAEALLVSTPPMPEPIPVDVVDIAQSEALVERYGTRIPVLRRNDTGGAELDWPFTRDQLLTFLQ